MKRTECGTLLVEIKMRPERRLSVAAGPAGVPEHGAAGIVVVRRIRSSIPPWERQRSFGDWMPSEIPKVSDSGSQRML